MHRNDTLRAVSAIGTSQMMQPTPRRHPPHISGALLQATCARTWTEHGARPPGTQQDKWLFVRVWQRRCRPPRSRVPRRHHPVGQPAAAVRALVPPALASHRGPAGAPNSPGLRRAQSLHGLSSLRAERSDRARLAQHLVDFARMQFLGLVAPVIGETEPCQSWWRCSPRPSLWR